MLQRMYMSTASGPADVQGSAVRAAANTGPSERGSGTVLAAFNSGSPLHAALVAVGSSSLGRAQAWALMATDDTDSEGSLVDNLIALQDMMVSSVYGPSAACVTGMLCFGFPPEASLVLHCMVCLCANLASPSISQAAGHSKVDELYLGRTSVMPPQDMARNKWQTMRQVVGMPQLQSIMCQHRERRMQRRCGCSVRPTSPPAFGRSAQD